MFLPTWPALFDTWFTSWTHESVHPNTLGSASSRIRSRGLDVNNLNRPTARMGFGTDRQQQHQREHVSTVPRSLRVVTDRIAQYIRCAFPIVETGTPYISSPSSCPLYLYSGLPLFVFARLSSHVPLDVRQLTASSAYTLHWRLSTGSSKGHYTVLFTMSRLWTSDGNGQMKGLSIADL
jgi:hypothetical protein